MAAAGLLATSSFEALAAPTAPTVHLETDVREQYYDVYGTSADAVFASIQRQGLGGKAGLAASGLTRSELSTSLSTITTDTSCRLVEVRLRAEVVVTLPKHASPGHLDEDTRRQWEAYETLVEFHEYRHVEIEFQGVQELEARLSRETVPSADTSAGACQAFVERAVEEQARVTQRRHEAFHEKESVAVREAQTALLREIDDVDATLSHERDVIERLEADLAAHRAEHAEYAHAVDDLIARYGHELPPPEFARVEEMNRVIEVLAEEMNRLAARLNRRAARYNARLAERGDLEARLSWTR